VPSWKGLSFFYFEKGLKWAYIPKLRIFERYTECSCFIQFWFIFCVWINCTESFIGIISTEISLSLKVSEKKKCHISFELEDAYLYKLYWGQYRKWVVFYGNKLNGAKNPKFVIYHMDCVHNLLTSCHAFFSLWIDCLINFNCIPYNIPCLYLFELHVCTYCSAYGFQK